MKQSKEKLDVLKHDLLQLSKTLYKVVEIDLNEKVFYSVRADDTYEVNSIDDWIADFGKENVYPEDRERFFNFFNADKVKKDLRDKWMTRVFYRRRVGDGWRFVSAEVIALDSYREDDPIVLLVVRDIDDYIKDFREQLTDYCKEHWQE